MGFVLGIQIIILIVFMEIQAQDYEVKFAVMPCWIATWSKSLRFEDKGPNSYFKWLKSINKLATKNVAPVIKGLIFNNCKSLLPTSLSFPSWSGGISWLCSWSRFAFVGCC